MKSVKSILVVGSGTAGLISALILKKHLNADVSVVFSKKTDIVGVGEGSTEHFRNFMEFIGIDQYTLIRECDATYKSGIMFQDWGKKNYLHSVINEFSYTNAQYHTLYSKLISENNPYVNYDFLWQNKVNKWYFNRKDSWPFNQFHFNTYKLNDFLKRVAKDLGIKILEDDIQDVVLDEQGYIKELKGEASTYNYDFYIDSTGFKRVLINKLGAKWKSYSKYLKMKSAITFPTGDEENYNVWTLAKAMDHGWMFRLPVWGRYGNGYIYDSDYITKDQAKEEIDRYFGQDIEIGKEFNFDPGCLDKVWIKNCCAVGLSSSFVEPLEASSIGTSIQQSFLLMHRLSNYDEQSVNDYNKSFNSIMENIRDFIALHYVTKKDNTKFWKDIQFLELPDSLNSRIERWKHRLPINEDFTNDSNFILFRAANFIMVMEGLEIFNRTSIKNEYMNLSKSYRDNADRVLNDIILNEQTFEKINHKDLIWLIRNV